MTELTFLVFKITADCDCSHKIKRCLLLGRKDMTNVDSVLKSRDITLPTDVHLVKAMVFQYSRMDVRIGLYKESWVPKSWWTVVLEKTLEGPLDLKMKPVNSKGNQPWIFIARTDGEAEAAILWLPYVKNWFLGKKTLMLGKIKGRITKGSQSMRWLDGITNYGVWASMVIGDGQGSLACCSPCGHNQTWLSEWTELIVRRNNM